MREVFNLVGVLDELASNVGELASPEPVDTGESSDFEVPCDRDLEIKRLGGDVEVEEPVIGLDSHSSVLRFIGVDVHVVTGALVGGVNYLIPGPGVGDARWIGLKLRFKPRDYAVLENAGRMFYVKSSFLDGEYFDGSFSDEAARDEVRNHVELRLIEEARRQGRFLLIDGPIFPTPWVLRTDSKYVKLYRGIIGSRVGALRGMRAVGVVKRLGESHYLSAYFKSCGSEAPMVDDVTLATRRVSQTFSSFKTAYLGPVVVDVDGWRKYMWYIVARLGGGVHVVRVEGLSDDIAEVGRDYVGGLLTVGGTALPIHIADRVARRLNASVVRLIFELRPGGLTYEGLEEVVRAMGELGERPS